MGLLCSHQKLLVHVTEISSDVKIFKFKRESKRDWLPSNAEEVFSQDAIVEPWLVCPAPLRLTSIYGHPPHISLKRGIGNLASMFEQL